MRTTTAFASCLAVALALAAGLAEARVLNFRFDPDDLIRNYSTAPVPVSSAGGVLQKFEQENPRRVHETFGTVMYNTFGATNPLPETDAASHATYLAWRTSLDQPGEGIASFNIWLAGDVLGFSPWSWGERLVSNPHAPPSAWAASGWNVEVISLGPGLGSVIVWWTERDDNLINLTNDLDPFGFAIDAREIASQGDDYGAGTDAPDGTYRIWFGSSDIWNDNPAYAEWQGFEASMNVTAIPTPGAVVLFAAGLLGLAGIGACAHRRTPAVA
jgi:hypothetical protein